MKTVLWEMFQQQLVRTLHLKLFLKKGQGKNVATKTAERLGMKTVKEKKYPYSTKMFDYKKF
jgi:hypothetical protein